MHKFVFKCLHSAAGTTRGSPSRSQILATPASRSTKSPQFPTPHSTTPKSSKSMGKTENPSSFVSQLQRTCLFLIPKVELHKYLSTCVWKKPAIFTWQHVTASSAGCDLCSYLPTGLFVLLLVPHSKSCLFRAMCLDQGSNLWFFDWIEKSWTHSCSRRQKMVVVIHVMSWPTNTVTVIQVLLSSSLRAISNYLPFKSLTFACHILE